MKTIFFTIIFFTFFAFSAFFFSNSTLFPEKNRSVTLSLLDFDAEVSFDDWGIPYIKAKNAKDAYTVLGYTMAKDRLFQMDILRRIVTGRLSEIFGPGDDNKILNTDRLSQKLAFHKTMEDYLKRNSHRKLEDIFLNAQAYLDGINRYILDGPLPLEFHLLGVKPDPFKLSEMMAISGYMGFRFSEAFYEDLILSDLKDEVSAEKLSQISIGVKKDKNYIMDNFYPQSYRNKDVQTSSIKNIDYKKLEKISEVLSSLISPIHGSNSWVLSGSKTVSGSPLLANDPHIGLTNPNIFYEAHISYPGFELYGFYIPLISYAVIGNNSKKAWAFTMSEIDDLDLYIEKVSDDRQYTFLDNEKKAINSYPFEVKIKGGDSFKDNIEWGHRGPIITGDLLGLEKRDLSVNWSYYHPENHVLDALYGLNHAESLKDMESSLSKAAAPGLNVSYVNKEGDIAWWIMGKIPKRKNGSKGSFAHDGTNSNNDINGYYNFNENPHLINPETGIIITSNYYPEFYKEKPYQGYWQSSDRFERLHNLLNVEVSWDIEKTKVVQTDYYTQSVEKVGTTLISFLEKKESEQHKFLHKELSSWRGYSNKNEIAPTIYFSWLLFLLKDLVIDELGEERYHAFGKATLSWHFLINTISHKDSLWWDDIKTDEIEDRDKILERSLGQTINFLNKKLGRDMNKWQWGKLHRLNLKNPLGQKKPLDLVFSVGPYAVGGSTTNIANLSFNRTMMDFTATIGSAKRRIIDMSDPQNFVTISPLGNSGHFLSKHHSDQTKLYIDKQYREQSLQPKNISYKLMFKPSE